MRSPKNVVSALRPNAVLVEEERTKDGSIEECLTVFLANRECPWHCLMCDLWRDTTDDTVPDGAIAAQVRAAVAAHPSPRHVKLYNAGSFFDRRAIPLGDWPAIIELVSRFATVIVESHPRLIGADCRRLAAALRPRLQVAMGLETVEPEVLARLNKGMTVGDFDAAVARLRQDDIDVRAFILSHPPYLDGPSCEAWSTRSMAHAFAVGVECCVVIPTRSDSGAMDDLARRGQVVKPGLAALERQLEAGLRLAAGRVFADLWDVERIRECDVCHDRRVDRLRLMNRTQAVLESVTCERCHAGAS